MKVLYTPRELRNLIWRQWKRTYTHAKALQKRGLSQPHCVGFGDQRARRLVECWRRTCMQRLRKSYFDRLGLVPLMDSYQHWRVFS